MFSQHTHYSGSYGQNLAKVHVGSPCRWISSLSACPTSQPAFKQEEDIIIGSSEGEHIEAHVSVFSPSRSALFT